MNDQAPGPLGARLRASISYADAGDYLLLTGPVCSCWGYSILWRPAGDWKKKKKVRRGHAFGSDLLIMVSYHIVCGTMGTVEGVSCWNHFAWGL